MIYILCLLTFAQPLEMVSRQIDQKGLDTWKITYRFNQKLNPKLKLSVKGKVSTFNSIYHTEFSSSDLTSDKKSCNVEAAMPQRGQCFEEMEYIVKDNYIVIYLKHNHVSASAEMLIGSRLISIRSGDFEYKERLDLFNGEAF